MPDDRYAVYILASRTRTLYIGVTNDLDRRISQHRAGIGSRFTSRYSVTQLVYVEWATDPRAAIARGKVIKGWTRARKIALIESENPNWNDLAVEL